MRIGTYSFVESGRQDLVVGSRFSIVNCPHLKSLYMAGNDFYRHEVFELAQLPELKSVVLSYYDYGCFVRTRNVVFRGMNEEEIDSRLAIIEDYRSRR